EEHVRLRSVSGPGFVDQQDGDVVAHRIHQVATGTRQLVRGVIRLQRAPAGRAGHHLEQSRVEFHRVASYRARTTCKTSSRTRSMVPRSAASTLSRSSGSVLDGRTLNHHIGSPECCTVSPSRWSVVTSGSAAKTDSTASIAASTSATVLLTSPEAT